MLVAITLTDLERRIIPNKILIVGAVAGAAIAAVGDPGSLPERAIAAAAAGGVLFAAALAYPRGMGLGDVKLAATMGVFLGRNVGPALLVALLAGALVGLAMIAREGAAARKRRSPSARSSPSAGSPACSTATSSSTGIWARSESSRPGRPLAYRVLALWIEIFG